MRRLPNGEPQERLRFRALRSKTLTFKQRVAIIFLRFQDFPRGQGLRLGPLCSKNAAFCVRVLKPTKPKLDVPFLFVLSCPFLPLLSLFCPFLSCPSWDLGFSHSCWSFPIFRDFPQWSFSLFFLGLSIHQKHLRGTVPKGSATQSGHTILFGTSSARQCR